MNYRCESGTCEGFVPFKSDHECPKPDRPAREWWVRIEGVNGELDGVYSLKNRPAQNEGDEIIRVVERSAFEQVKRERDLAIDDVMFYRREWESACERAEYTREIELERDSWKAECEAMAYMLEGLLYVLRSLKFAMPGYFDSGTEAKISDANEAIRRVRVQRDK